MSLYISLSLYIYNYLCLSLSLYIYIYIYIYICVYILISIVMNARGPRHPVTRERARFHFRINHQRGGLDQHRNVIGPIETETVLRNKELGQAWDLGPEDRRHLETKLPNKVKLESVEPRLTLLIWKLQSDPHPHTSSCSKENHHIYYRRPEL